jgi:putative phosphoribosyl transferase
MSLPFPDREAAGQQLAEALDEYRDRDNILILALPRGGVPVAYQVAEHLGADLDLMIVRKLGMPGHEELAIGAIASGGERILNEDILTYSQVSEEALEEVTARERRELQRREQAYRDDRPWPDMTRTTVILVDDGLATGATMRAAATAVKRHQPREVVIAVPVAPEETIEKLRATADNVVCLETPPAFGAIGRWYRNFDQVSDDEVRTILNRVWRT